MSTDVTRTTVLDLDADLAGAVLARLVPGAQVYAIAPNKTKRNELAKDLAAAMRERLDLDESDELVNLRASASTIVVDGDRHLYVLAADSDTADGVTPSAVIAVDPQDFANLNLLRVLESGLLVTGGPLLVAFAKRTTRKSSSSRAKR